ncbi:DUF4362 domain-containing protein [Bacillus sp. BRMEA1]|uniref:DUF4362 domain-containing protein n=1 Tax=Neobacillus endophyticus TaxID=2738405 RepID=UPI0015644524|nr:DUF4362 domain-containing protein [Neobacillus endophyticus]NRD78511.1 DUF4362 domain-containing protein [Neobacillus endophyticus]
MQKYLLVMIFGIILLSGCSLNVGTSKNQEPDSKVGTENQKKSYQPETAIENGDIVNLHGKISNLDKFKNFIKNVKSGNKDKIRITMYTDEGDPIFYNLNYDSKQIQYTFDNSQDKFAGSDKGVKSTSCTDIGTKNTENVVEYHLSGCSSEVGNTFHFLVSK